MKLISDEQLSRWAKELGPRERAAKAWMHSGWPTISANDVLDLIEAMQFERRERSRSERSNELLRAVVVDVVHLAKVQVLPVELTSKARNALFGDE